MGERHDAQVQAAALHAGCVLHRVSEMLEVMDKADRLHVDEPMRRSMGEASTSGASSIRFDEVLLCSALLCYSLATLCCSDIHRNASDMPFKPSGRTGTL